MDRQADEHQNVESPADQALSGQRADAALALAAERLTIAIESIPDAFALFDGELKLVQCNGMYRDMLRSAAPTHDADWRGASYAQIIGHLATWPALSSEAQNNFRAVFASEQRSEPRVLDVRTRDGRRLRFNSRATPEGGLVAAIVDLSEDERRAEALRAARLEAELANATKADFLSSMSHELRTPMNAILGFAQLLQREKRDPLSPKNSERVAQILRGGEQLLRLIDDVLDFASIDAGRVSVQLERVDVRSVLEEVRAILEPEATLRAITLEVDGPTEDVPMLAADRMRTLQAVLNLGSNAVKYNRHRGHVRFSVSLPRAGYLRITVDDTGVGIPPEYQAKLFQPFQRAGQERGSIQGIGIGLPTSKRLVERMGGELGYRSELGKGSSFWLDLPIHAGAAHRESRRPVAQVCEDVAPANEPRTVLYVEDSPINLALMEDLFRGGFAGATLITRTNAEDGILAAQAVSPDAILMDINLPGMSGVEALAALRADERTRGIPVIALTAAASERDVRVGLRAGFLRYLSKPLRVEELTQALAAAYRTRSHT